MGEEAARIEFAKTDTPEAGVTWNYAIGGAGDDLTDVTLEPSLKATLSVEGDRTDAVGVLGTVPSFSEVEMGPMRLGQTDDGISVELNMGELLGPSQLIDVDELRRIMLESGLGEEAVDEERANRTIVADEGDDGVLAYVVELNGTIEVNGTEIEIDGDTVEFTVTE